MRASLIAFILFCSIFSSAVFARKRVLDLSDKNLDSVAGLTVPKRIRKLILQINEITSLEGLVLPEKLKTLYVNNNKITSLQGLEANENLKMLDVSSNPIENYEALQGLTGLEKLFIQFNSASNESLDFNVINVDLISLSISGNAFTELDLGTFENLEELNIKAMFPSTRGFSEDLLVYSKVALPPNLKTIFLGSFDYPDDFTDLVLPNSIEEIDLASSFMTEDELSTLTLPPNLKKLRLKRNNISSFDTIELPESLTELNIQLNPISKEERQKLRARLGKRVKIVFKCGRKCSNRP